MRIGSDVVYQPFIVVTDKKGVAATVVTFLFRGVKETGWRWNEDRCAFYLELFNRNIYT